jgi:hypothetical protein
MKVTAEGVEAADQHLFLRAAVCIRCKAIDLAGRVTAAQWPSPIVG